MTRLTGYLCGSGAAAAGSRNDIQRLLDLGRESQTILFFPAFSPHLHPRGIPDVEQLALDNPAIENAVDSLTYLSMLQIPLEFAPIIWDRCWPWMQFLHTSASPIPSLERRSEAAFYTMFLLLLVLAVTHLNRHSRGQQGPRIYLAFAGAIVFVKRDKTPAFQDALRSHGVIKAVTSAACALNSGRYEGAEGASYQKNCSEISPAILDLSNLHFSEPQACPFIREAIWGGFLSVIVECATHTDACEEAFIQLLYVLEPYTVYYSVLSCLDRALPSVEDLQNRPVFVQSRVSKAWSDFRNLAQERITVMKHYESDEYISLKACDSVETVDWKDGHKDFCRRMRADLLEAPEHLSARDRSFLHALVHHDYKLRQLNILLGEFQSINTSPNDTFCLKFDYTNGGVYMDFTPLGQLHFVILPNGSATLEGAEDILWIRVFPLQSSSSVLVDGLQGLKAYLQEQVNGSALSSEQIQNRIAGLIQAAAPDLLQIH
ncbi:hypothetical protein C8R43DRAFT_1147550 [Mycena crocata]|nr:hypothetical protein C8R43DRAFT_1147550 [Mycena crocata]